MIDSWLGVASATNEELATELQNCSQPFLREKILEEINRRVAAKRDEAEPTKPFDPKTDLSADARYLWNRIFIWFWVVPVVLGVLAYILAHAKPTFESCDPSAIR
jgi:hypothetical protein